MTTLIDLVGKRILIRLSFQDDPERFQTVLLRNVEQGGIWLESQNLTDSFIGKGKTASPVTPLVFVPYPQIVWILVLQDVPSVSVSALGV